MTEEDGRVNNFQVSAASTPFLTRQGQVRYKLAAGQPRPSMSHQTENETFFSNEVSWGMLSNTSLYGGLLLSGDDYHSAAMGIGQNMLWLGALSFDVTWASSHFDTQQDERGLSYRFNYSKQVDATNSTISSPLIVSPIVIFTATPTILITNTTTAMRRTKNRRSAYLWANRLPH